MITPDQLDNRAVLSDRQREVVALVTRYVSVAREFPSSGWLSRRLNISPARARQHIDALRRKNSLPPLPK